MKIDFIEFGKRGKPIIFLHGWQQDIRSFSPLVPFLHQNHRLFLLDLPGFGKTKAPKSNFSSKDYAKTIKQWLESKKLTEVILVGHSFGGKIASLIAAKYPQRISKLVIIACSGLPHPKKWYPFLEFIPQSLKKTLHPWATKIFASRDYKEAGDLLPIFKNLVKEDLRPVFQNIKTQTLIIWGKDDAELPLADGQEIHQKIKNSRLILVEGGHFPFQENPQKIAKLIDDFAQK